VFRRRAKARNVSFGISLRWRIRIIKTVDKTKLKRTLVWKVAEFRTHYVPTLVCPQLWAKIFTISCVEEFRDDVSLGARLSFMPNAGRHYA